MRESQHEQSPEIRTLTRLCVVGYDYPARLIISGLEGLGGHELVQGSCLCSGIAWEVAGDDFTRMSHCHCSRCRKAHGAAFATFVVATARGFRWLRGPDLIRHFEFRGGDRPFCSRCGSAVCWEPDQAGVLMPAGCLDEDPGVRPERHIFVGSKAPWAEISDALPQHDDNPGGDGGAESPVPAPRQRPAAVRGSCLCGGVAYNLEGDLTLMVNCHCSRCRKARAAAHATNLFLASPGFHWIRGEELLREFKLPDAERFTHCFCGTCGSSMPRVLGERALVPAGSLDDDPGARARLHIYTGSKAPWYEITDSLPQHEESAPPHR